MSYKTTILYIVMGGAQNTTAQRALLKQSAADLRLPIHAVMMGDEGDHRPVSFVSSEASGVDGAVVMTAHAPSAARLIANGCPTIYCHNEAIWADSAPWRITVRSGEEIPVTLAENPRPLPPKPIQVQPKVAGVGSVISLVGRGEPIEPIPAGRVTFAEALAKTADDINVFFAPPEPVEEEAKKPIPADRVTFAKPLPKNSKVAERATRIKMASQETGSCDLDMDLLRYAMMTGDASAEPTKAVGAKKPKRGRTLPKKRSYPYRDENGNLWVSAVKKLSPRFIFLYKDIARSVSLFTADGMTMDAISEKLGHGGFKVSPTTVWVIQQGIKAGAWPHLK